ncbi:MAG: hypothetical protein ACKVU4_06050 [Phycisphaerales bacterium]
MSTSTDQLILIVVGAHLRAETGDRPLAYLLRQRMLEWLGEGEGDGQYGGSVVVCSDVWYLNREELRSRPAISVGGPGVNAFSAFLADKLPSAFSIEGVLLVQLDLDFEDRLACVWGMDHASTVSAVDAFIERYLDDFMTAAVADREDDED